MSLFHEYNIYRRCVDSLDSLKFFKGKYLDDGDELFYMAYFTRLQDHKCLRENLHNKFLIKRLDNLENKIYEHK